MAKPTDSSYAVVAPLDDKAAADAAAEPARPGRAPPSDPTVRDLAEIGPVRAGRFNKLGTPAQGRYTPGPWTFILEATREVRAASHPSRKTIGIRV